MESAGLDRTSKILLALGAALAASAFFLPVINPDLFWHLAAGREMFARGAAPRADFLSWTMAGRPWFDFEWLAQLVYYFLYLEGGFAALYALKAALLLLAMVPVWLVIRLHKAEASAFWLLPLLAAALVTNSDLRPENFTLLFFALVFWRLEAARLAPSFRAGLPALAAAAALFALWANLHAGFLYGAALIGFYAAGNFFAEALPFIYGREKRVPAGKWAQYLKLLAAALAASFLNPYGARLYEVMANHQRHLAALQEYIQEWKPFDLTNIYQWPYLALLVLAFGRLLYRFLKEKAMVYEHLIALLFFAWASSSHARHSPFFSAAAAVSLAAAPFGAGSAAAARAWLRPALKFVLVAVLSLYYWLFVWAQYAGPAWFATCSEGLAGFLKANAPRLSGLKMLNYWGWGGWLGFELGPEYKVFADGRYLFHEHLEELMNCRSSPAAWENFNRKYGFGLMVLSRDQSKVAVKQKFSGGREAVVMRPAYLFYLPRKDWALVYWDLKAMVLVKRALADPAWLAANEFTALRAGDMNNAAAAALSGELGMKTVRAEAKRFLALAEAPPPAGTCPCGLDGLFGRGAARKYIGEWRELLERGCGEKSAKCKP